MNSQAGQEISEKQRRLEQLEQEKAELEVKLMVMRRKDEAKLLELQKKDEELRELKKKLSELEADRAKLEEKFAEVEREDKAKFAQQYETITKISKHLEELYAKYNQKEEETKELRNQLDALKQGMDDIDGAKSAKTKYKEMGKKMLAAMKQMDADIKGLMAKLEASQAELKQAYKEKRKLSKQNQELLKEREVTEVCK